MKSQTNLYSNLILKKLFLQKDFLKETPIIETTNGRTISFTDFLHQIDSVAISLIKSGFKKGDKVLFLAKPSIESIVYIFAVIRAGGVLVLADPAMGKDNFIGRVNFAKPEYVLVDPILNTVINTPYIEPITKYFNISIPDINTLKKTNRIIVKKRKDRNQDFNEINIEDEGDSVIIFTSGTTGIPKGVVHTYGSLFEILNKIEDILNIEHTDVFYSSQLHFLLASILSGARVILPSNLNFDTEKFYKHIVKYRVNKTFGIPAEYNKTIEFCTKNNLILPETLETVVLGSAPVLRGFLSKLKKVISKNTKVICVYGATEILPIAYVELQDKLSSTTSGDLLGRTAPGVTINIIGNEICVSGNNLFNRYLGLDKVTEHHTGDLGLIDNDSLVLLGRKKDMIIRKNHNIYPSIFESTISNIPGIKNCAMVGIYNNELEDEKIYLAIEKNIDAKEDDKVFEKRIFNELSKGENTIDKTALPDKIIIMNLPLGGRTQKIDKNKIKDYITKNNLC